MALMGPGAASSTAGKTMMRGLRRVTRDMTEDELRVNLTEIRDLLDLALNKPHEAVLLETSDDGSHDLTTVTQGF